MRTYLGRNLSNSEKDYQIKRLLKALEVQLIEKLKDIELTVNSGCEFDLCYELSVVKDRNSKNPSIIYRTIGDIGILPVGRKS